MIWANRLMRFVAFLTFIGGLMTLGGPHSWIALFAIIGGVLVFQS